MNASFERQLNVFINSSSVATLYENNGLWRLHYHTEWLNQPATFALAPSLPLQSEPIVDSGSQRPVQWFFDNLLPEELARAVLARDARVDAQDAFGLLELVGAESAGAITLLRPDESITQSGAEPISDAELHHRIAQLPRSPMNQRDRKRMSLAGAQHKMLLIVHDNQLFEPVGNMPSSHILKPEHEDKTHYPFTARNEYFVMTLASLCGLDVPDVAIRYIDYREAKTEVQSEAVYITKRFDRIGEYPSQQRIHVLDACQVLGLAAYRKYTGSTIDTLRTLVDSSRTKVATALALYRWLVFNFFVGNGDAHLKNLTFRSDHNGLTLLPHYDLLSTVVYEKVGDHPQAELSQPLGNARYFYQVTRADLLSTAESLGLNKTIGSRVMDDLSRKLLDHAPQLIDHVAQAPFYPGQAGELRLLRQIQHLAIEKFTAQVGC
ncbi:MAG TPA: HipA domain-containing protein [Pseudidiomarina sp.]|nr:HipA domain-containing protein [Pseudidiomarina sp.]